MKNLHQKPPWNLHSLRYCFWHWGPYPCTPISLGLVWTPSAHTFKLQGFLHHTPITILIDTGSSHNILKPRLAHHLNLCTLPIKPFSIMVGNNEKIHCTHLNPTVPVFIQNHYFSIPLYLIRIEGTNVVLGKDWIRCLGPRQADFSTPQLSFHHQGTIAPACWPERWRMPRQRIDVRAASHFRSSSGSISRTYKETIRRRCGRTHSDAQVSDGITKY